MEKSEPSYTSSGNTAVTLENCSADSSKLNQTPIHDAALPF